MNSMIYKGYTARIEYDERDGLFVGRVLGLRDIVSFQGESVETLRDNLAAAVDDYLGDCAERGIEPEKPASGRLMLRIPPEVHGAALVAARAAGKSLNQWAAETLAKAAQR